MIKDIKYSGYAAVPSDYECPDGQLAQSLNLLNEDGTIKPILPPSVIVKEFGSSDEVLYIHKTSATASPHYITYGEGKLSWVTQSDGVVSAAVPLRAFSRTDLKQVTSVGNTLIVLAADGIHYFLWKADNNAYSYLGTHFPECPISFGLQGTFKSSDEFEVSFDKVDYQKDCKMTTSNDPFCKLFSDNNKKTITSAVLAKVNKFISEESTQKGKFIFPFFVRYAYRLYDGTLTMHSAPILMTASTDITPEVAILHVDGPDSSHCNKCKMQVLGMLHKLDYAAVLQSRIDMLKDWSDIISSVDIFVSKPIYTYDQNGECVQFEVTQESDSYHVCKLTNQAAPTSTYPARYQQHKMHNLYALHNNNFDTIYRYRVKLPSKSQDAIWEEIKTMAGFYFLESIKIDNLKTERTAIDVKEDYLQSLVTREVMTDDYDSHDTLIAGSAFVYNGRLNITNIKKKLYDTYNAGAMVQYTDGNLSFASDSTTIPMLDTTTRYTVFFHIKQDGKNIVVEGESFTLASYPYASITFLFYPNINAYKATIVTSDGNWIIEVPLEKHSMLNGAFYFNGWESPENRGQYCIASRSAIIDLPNKVYQSEVNNPFFFPLLGINTIGTGTIKGICAAVKALSQGQFGQFPLYAFTDEGVWAMELSATGTYSAKQPVTRDVVIGDGSSITQLDSAVLFATDRGIMLISGSQTQCISESIDTQYPTDILSLPGMSKLADESATLMPFKEYISQSQIIYDYKNQRIIIFRPDAAYAYMFSMKSKQWGLMESDIKSAVNSYPDAYAVTNSGALINLSDPDEEKSLPGLLVTRPLKLETPDVLKTMDTVIQRGNFARGHVQSVLHGSRDLINWHLVWSSKDHYLRGFRGTPYKYFRIALSCNMDARESIFGASLQFSPRQTNQPR